MDVMHHLLSGFKATFSDCAVSHIDEIRQRCGGVGFSSNAGFTEAWQNVAPIPTYEGDNIVMLGQAARFLFKQVKNVAKGKTPPFPFEYLTAEKRLSAIKNRGVEMADFNDLEFLTDALAMRALH